MSQEQLYAGLIGIFQQLKRLGYWQAIGLALFSLGWCWQKVVSKLTSLEGVALQCST